MNSVQQHEDVCGPFWTAALDTASEQLHVPAALPPREEASDTHWIESPVDPSVGLGAVEKR